MQGLLTILGKKGKKNGISTRSGATKCLSNAAPKGASNARQWDSKRVIPFFAVQKISKQKVKAMTEENLFSKVIACFLQELLSG